MNDPVALGVAYKLIGVEEEQRRKAKESSRPRDRGAT